MKCFCKKEFSEVNKLYEHYEKCEVVRDSNYETDSEIWCIVASLHNEDCECNFCEYAEGIDALSFDAAMYDHNEMLR